MSEYMITVSILTAVLALLYLIALRIGEIGKDISCMHDQVHYFLEEMIKPIEEPKSQPSEVPSPFTEWDES
tara:strand:+ start:761 stop:973 length:213 start_codon:yes stop_codon:yes gene_type:complete